MSCYFERLGELFLSDSCTEEALLAVPIIAVKVHAATVEVTDVEIENEPVEENTGPANSVVINPPVMSAQINTIHMPSSHTNEQASFDQLKRRFMTEQQEEQPNRKSFQRAGTQTRIHGSLSLRKPRHPRQAPQEEGAYYALPEVALTLYSVELGT